MIKAYTRYSKIIFLCVLFASASVINIFVFGLYLEGQPVYDDTVSSHPEFEIHPLGTYYRLRSELPCMGLIEVVDSEGAIVGAIDASSQDNIGARCDGGVILRRGGCYSFSEREPEVNHTGYRLDLEFWIRNGRFRQFIASPSIGRVKEMLGEPDDTGTGKAIIWRFGCIEFHFTQNGELTLIHIDNFAETSSLDNMWGLGPNVDLTLMSEKLTTAGVQFATRKSRWNEGVCLLTNHGVTLEFDYWERLFAVYQCIAATYRPWVEGKVTRLTNSLLAAREAMEQPDSVPDIVIERLVHLFHLQPPGSMRDFALESRAAHRIDEFVLAYQTMSLTDSEKFGLMLVIVASFEDMIRSQRPDDVWIKIERLLIQDWHLHRSTVAKAGFWDAPSFDSCAAHFSSLWERMHDRA
ncbi:MAG: hypothetical protein R3E66_22610 [bacterium]